MSRPSFLYRLSVHMVTRAAPLVARFDKKVARGLDGRSLNCWRRNLGRAGGRAPVRGAGRGSAMRLVEVVARSKAPVEPARPSARYRIVVGGMAVEVCDDFHEDTLARLLDVVRSC